MVFGNASVTQFKFDRNASAVLNAPQVIASSPNIHTLERTTTAISNALFRTFNIRNTTTQNMADGFGPGLVFEIKDDTSANTKISGIFSARSGADNSGRIIFETTNAGTDAEKMTIMPDGKVGIGTAAPATQLDVVGGNVRIQSGSTLEYGNASTRIVGNSGTGGFFRFDTENTERMRILGNGNVGIATTTPGEKLEVNGNAKATTFISTQATGTAPLTVASTTAVTNLNADLLDGNHASAF
jgi:hypothetical protein